MKTGKQHGFSKTSTYKSWICMKQRCFNMASDKFKDYGGRGITVCEQWRNSFMAFLRDMGERPKGHTLDRIETDGNYEPGNCRWAIPLIQGNNRRSNHQLTAFGKTQNLSQWAREIQVNVQTIHERLKRGCCAETAVSKEKIQIRGERQHLAKLTSADVRAILLANRAGMRTPDIAARFSVTTTNIRYIVARKTWKHVEV